MAALALPASAAAQEPTGGTYAGEPPAVSGVTCLARCAGLDRASRGSTVRVTGRALGGATAIVFLGGRGSRDDVTAPASAVTSTRADAIVPARAHTGQVRVLGAGGQPSNVTSRRLLLGRAAKSSAPRIEARVNARRVFLQGARKATLTFFVGGDAPAQVRVDLLREGDAVPVATWSPAPVAPGTVQTVRWDGTSAGATAPEGTYEFRVSATDGSSGGPASAAQLAPAAASSRFVLLAHAFPIQGRHKIGMSPTQRFGAARSGHTHQGQDVFADCGTPLIAARGGKVKFRATQAAAGNYVIVAGDDGVDYGYMHLRDPALVTKGETVATGQQLGYVGDTGDADGCHLHFEEWSAPGWYTGGHPYDPLPDLLAWDV